jgi:aspartate/methionine/tyrosine aminotransferase
VKLRHFLLDRWLNINEASAIEFHLGSSTGPRWTLGEVLDLEPGSRERLFGADVVYPPGTGTDAMRAALAGMYSVPPEQVLVVAGGSEALLHIFMLAAEPGANVIVPFPGFPPYAAIPEALGIEVRSYHLRPASGHRIDVDEVTRLIDRRTKLLLVNSPHNPTGATIDPAQMRQLHDLAAAHGIQFVSDEVFHPIYHAAPGASAAALPQATVVGDLSKALSLSGLRLGWIVERSEERLAQYLNAREYFTISNTTIGELVGEIAIRNRETIWNRTRDVAQRNLQHVRALMEAQAGVLEWVPPGGGMTCFPRFVSGADSRAFCERAARSGVLVVPGDCFDVPDSFRLGFGTGGAEFPAAMQRLQELLSPAHAAGAGGGRASRSAGG